MAAGAEVFSPLSRLPKRYGHAGQTAALADNQRINVRLEPVRHQPTSVVTDQQMPSWLEPTEKRLSSLLGLEPNWDGYGASEVQFDEAVRALQMLIRVLGPDSPQPSVVPLSTGGLQVEWHRGGMHLEIEFEPGHPPAFDYQDESGETTDGQLPRDIEVLTRTISILG